ncbi:MAG: PKD domain-containing protein [Cyclobacteriaceae bacterium]|nr:PKD domain-containing protein [Cyclobacteriaceae bacterium SS2]
MRYIYLAFLFKVSLIAIVNAQFTITPPSPSGAGLAKSANTNMDLYSGRATISIPLTSIANSNGMNIPIGLIYTTGGIKVQDIAGPVGLGWSLAAGGTITRTVKGLPDLEGNFYNTSSPEYGQIADGLKDGEHDDFYFSFPGGQGKFQVSKDGNSVYTIPYQEVEIKKYGTLDDCYWVITDIVGNQYYYGGTSASRETMNIERSNDDGTYDADEDDFTSTWHLTKIVPISKAGDITFSYVTGPNYFYEYFASIGYDSDGDGYFTEVSSELDLINTKVIIKSPKYLSQIETSLGFVNYYWADDRLGYELMYLDSINTKDYNLELIEAFKFNYFYFDANESFPGTPNPCTDRLCMRLGLESIEKIINKNRVTFKKFEYFKDNVIEGINHYALPPRNSPHFDHWGYCNNQGFPTGFGLINLLPLNSSNQYYVNSRYLNFERSKSCSLHKIIDHNGAFTNFIYEAHTPSSGGLRIKEVQYGEDENVLQSEKFYYTNGYKVNDPNYLIENESKGTVYSSSQNTLFDVNGATIGYEKVTKEYSNGGEEEFTFHTYSDKGDISASRTVVYYSFPIVFPDINLNTTKWWERGLLKQHEVINKESANPFTKKVINYNFNNTENILDNLYVISVPYGGGYIVYNYKTISKALTINIVDNYRYEGTSTSSLVKTQYYYVESPSGYQTSIRSKRNYIDGKEYLTEFRYPFDLYGILDPEPTGGDAAIGYWNMVDRHVVTPIETVVSLKNGDLGETEYSYISGQLNLFKKHNYGGEEYIVPTSTSQLALADPSPSHNFLSIINVAGSQMPLLDSDYRTVAQYAYSYDVNLNSDGALQSYTGSDGISTTYTWGHGNTLVTSESSNGFTTNYIYDPLVGLTKSTDPNNRDTKYEYDPYNNLKLIRDHEDNIIKRYRHHYKGQEEEMGGSIHVNANNLEISFVNESAESFYGDTRFIWDFGDGNVVETEDAFTTHTYATTGQYDITLSMINPEYNAAQISYNDLEVNTFYIRAWASIYCQSTGLFQTKSGDFHSGTSSTSHFLADDFSGTFCNGILQYKWQYRNQGASLWFLIDTFSSTEDWDYLDIPTHFTSNVGSYEVRLVMVDDCDQEFYSNTVVFNTYDQACP